MTTPVGPGGYPPPGGGAPLGYQPAPGGADSSGKARTALILSILGLCCIICPIIGLVLGYQAQKEMAVSGNRNGEGMAKAAIIVGWIMIALAITGLTLRFTLLAHQFGTMRTTP